MANFQYDLHTHTTTSDGKLHWEELLHYAKESGLKGIAITDHNTLGPVAEIIQEAKKIGLRYMPATEIKTTCKKQIDDYESLGNHSKIEFKIQELIIYGMEPNNKEFLQMSQEHLKGKTKYIHELCRILNQLRTSDIPGLTIDEPLQINANTIIEKAGKYVGATLIIEELMQKYKPFAASENFGKGDVKKLVIDNQAKAMKLMEDDPFYGLDIVEGLKKAKQWGKIVVMAHPFTKSRSELADFYETHLIPLLAANGLDGIEYSYPEHTSEHHEIIKRMAQKHNLILTGGSDFHRKEDKLYMLGSCGVDEPVFLDLEKQIK